MLLGAGEIRVPSSSHPRGEEGRKEEEEEKGMRRKGYETYASDPDPATAGLPPPFLSREPVPCPMVWSGFRLRQMSRSFLLHDPHFP